MNSKEIERALILAGQTYLSMSKMGPCPQECSGCGHEIPPAAFYIKGSGFALCVDCCSVVTGLFTHINDEQVQASRPVWCSHVEHWSNECLPFRVRINLRTQAVEVKVHPKDVRHRSTKDYFLWLVTHKGYVKRLDESNETHDVYSQPK